jgi:hypothetical protein
MFTPDMPAQVAHNGKRDLDPRTSPFQKVKKCDIFGCILVCDVATKFLLELEDDENLL